MGNRYPSYTLGYMHILKEHGIQCTIVVWKIWSNPFKCDKYSIVTIVENRE
jgi:hypothetical protein